MDGCFILFGKFCLLMLILGVLGSCRSSVDKEAVSDLEQEAILFLIDIGFAKADAVCRVRAVRNRLRNPDLETLVNAAIRHEK